MIRGLEHLPFEDRLGRAGNAQPGEGKGEWRPHSTFQKREKRERDPALGTGM